MISFEDFQELDIRIAEIISAEEIPSSDKLLKLKVNLDEDGDEERQIVAGIKEFFVDPKALVGRKVPIVANLEPKEIMGLLSEGMLLAINNEESFSLLVPDEDVPPGSPIH